VTECPGCHGDGHHDFRDDDALIGETWTDEEIEQARVRGMEWPLGVVTCDVCDGTGYVDDDVAADMRAAAVAQVDQLIARVRQQLAEEARAHAAEVYRRHTDAQARRALRRLRRDILGD